MSYEMYEDHPLSNSPSLHPEVDSTTGGNGFSGGSLEELERALNDVPFFVVNASSGVHPEPDWMERPANTSNLSGESSLNPLDAQTEVENLAAAMANDNPAFVDRSGIIHIELDGDVSTQNMIQVDGNVFGAPSEQDEVQQLADAMYNDNGDGYWVDEFGRIRLGADPVGSENMTKVDGNIFGALAEDDEIRQLADALYENEDVYVDTEGKIHVGGGVTPGKGVTEVNGHIFGAHEDQWYNKNPRLMKAEVATMRKHYPKAAFSYYSTNGNMYWIVSLSIFQNKNITKPWQFLLVYDKDHPHNHGFGGSIKVVPLRPSLEELKKIALQHGRPGVPHIISNENHFLKRYLCTRWPKDIESGEDLVSSATQAAAWAADWAAHFEVGIRDKKVWNKWCDDDHFRHLMVE